MFRNMARSLLTYGRIRTTETKAKELRKVVDRLVTLALRNDLHAMRLAYKVLENHTLVKKLFEEIGPRFVGVQGGFTRVVKLGLPRPGDAAPLAIIELTRGVDEAAKSEKKTDKAKKDTAKKDSAKKEASKKDAAKAAAKAETAKAPKKAVKKQAPVEGEEAPKPKKKAVKKAAPVEERAAASVAEAPAADQDS